MFVFSIGDNYAIMLCKIEPNQFLKWNKEDSVYNINNEVCLTGGIHLL